MQSFSIISLAVLVLFCGLAAYSQTVPTSKPDLDLGFSPRESIIQRALMKAGSLDRRLAAEKLMTPQIRSGIDEYDITYYDIFWQPDFSDSTIYGEVTIHGRSVVAGLGQVLVFLHENMVIDSAYNTSGELSALHQGALVHVTLDQACDPGEEFHFTIVYKGQPAPFEFFIEGLAFTEHQGVPIVENLSEPYNARTWWPCKDVPWDKADSVDIRVRVDTGMVATSNGLLLSDINHGDGTHTMHWSSRYPITTYLVCLAVTNFVSYTDYYFYSPTDSMPIVNYIFPEREGDPLLAMDVTPLAISVFADLFCEYPFINEKYGHTQCRIHGMEHQTNTFLNYFYLCDEATIVHELAHHWWGNLVTCETWHDIWLNEGFGTYCEALFYEVVNGPDWLHAYMNEVRFTDDGTLYVYDVTDPWIIMHTRSYFKGAWVLHMLRGVLGDEAFFNGMQQYASLYAYGTATTDEFQQVMEDVSGQDLDYFFEEWLHGEYYPNYRYSYLIEDNLSGGRNVYLHLRQRHTTEPQVFSMPVDIHLQTDTGAAIVSVFNDKREQDFIISTDFDVNYLEVDPVQWILKYALWEEYDLHIANEELSQPYQAEQYLDSVIAKGGSGEYFFELISGAMPGGWDLDTATGIISGCCYEDGSYTFEIKATDAVYSSYYFDSTIYTVTMNEPAPRPGDANADSEVNVGDAVHTINYVFSGGSPPPIPNWADVNADCDINVGDAVYLIMYIFNSGPEPQMGCVE
jgi:hypothetical protein